MGIKRIFKTAPNFITNSEFLNIVGTSGLLPEFDKLSNHIDNHHELLEITTELEKILLLTESRKISKVQTFIRNKVKVSGLLTQ